MSTFRGMHTIHDRPKTMRRCEKTSHSMDGNTQGVYKNEENDFQTIPNERCIFSHSSAWHSVRLDASIGGFLSVASATTESDTHSSQHLG